MPRIRNLSAYANTTAVVIILVILCLGQLYLRQGATQPSSLLVSNHSLPQIPRNLWQVFLGYSPFERLGESVQSWILANQDYSYVLLSNDGATSFVHECYSDRPKVLHTFMDIGYPIFRADLLRYMLLESKGGIYSDVDTTALKPIREWIPPQYQSQTRAVVGIEYDQLDASSTSHGFMERLSFCQWTLVATSGHPMMTRIVERVVEALQDLARQKGVHLSKLEVPDDQVGSITGPGIWTDVVLESLSAATRTKVTCL